MELLILLIIAGILGYFLSFSRYSRNIDQTSGRVASSSEGLFKRTSRWFRTRFGRGKQANTFLVWATGAGADHFPEDFKSWLKSLSPDEADQFTRSLVASTQGLGYRLDDFVSGMMDNKPAQMQIFVEAVVIYSNEYRKAHQAQLEAKKAEENGEVRFPDIRDALSRWQSRRREAAQPAQRRSRGDRSASGGCIST